MHLAGLGIGTRTNEDGVFPLSGVPPGTHTLRAEHADFGSAECAIPVRAGGESRASFRVD